MKIKDWMGIAVFAMIFLTVGFDSRAEGREIVFEDESLKKRICLLLGKEEESPLYKEELEAHKGQFSLRGDISVYNGEELDILRSYFRLEDVSQWYVEFAPDLDGWTQKQLEGLKDMKRTVRIRSTGRTVPAEVLPYFTGAEELEFEVRDVLGQVPEGKKFPENIKSVTLLSYASARYGNLLKCMQGSEVKTLECFCDSFLTTGQNFWLDKAAGLEKLEYLDVGNSRIRVREAEKLEGMKLRELTGVVDKSTELSFIDTLSSLGKVTGAVVEERNLTPLLEKEELGLRLRFCQEMAEFEEDIYPDGVAVISPEWDACLDWKEKEEEAGNFLAIYQRYMDGGRKVECFSVRSMKEPEDTGWYPMRNVRTFLRVTDGKEVCLLNPGDMIDPEYAVFGDYQRDSFQLIDINFDGVKDIVLDKGSFGNQGLHFEYGWIWDGGRSEYIFSKSYLNIFNPRVDSEHKLVRSSCRNGATSHSWAIYRYENGEFVCIGDLTEELLRGEGRETVQAPAGAEVWQWTETKYENGREVETRSFTVTDIPGEETEYPEEYYRFYEEDSYWGG